MVCYFTQNHRKSLPKSSLYRTDCRPMDLAFNEDQEAIREEFRRVLASSSARTGLECIEAKASCDQTLWQTLAETGWLGAGLSEDNGGSDLGDVTLCLLAEEIGRQGVAVPFTASACGFATGLARSGATAAIAQWLPQIADGSAIGTVLLPSDWKTPAQVSESGDGQARLSGTTQFIRDGAASTVALSLIGSGENSHLVLLPLVDGVRAPDLERTLDLLHPPAAFEFDHQPIVILASGAAAETQWQALIDRYGLYAAFEQLGGAQAALQMAREYSLTRYAFGRAIGSFQALKHSMADMLAAIEMARSNCYFGAASLDGAADQLREATAVARISATEAFRLCARQNIQIHGGIGITWESDAQLYYRRAQSLASSPGSSTFWKERLMQLLIRRHTPTT